MAFLPLLVAIALAVRPGRCDNTCSSISWGVDTSLANLVPNFNPDAEETCADGLGCASKCSEYPWCSSFFIQKSGRCLMFKTVFITKVKMVSAPGTVYNRIYSDDCPADASYYKSREDSLCLRFFGLGPDTISGITKEESVKNCSTIHGFLPILDTENKMEWVKGVFESNVLIPSDGWNIYLDGKRRAGSSFVWGNGQIVPFGRDEGNRWLRNFPIAFPAYNCMAAVIRAKAHITTIRWVNFDCSYKANVLLCRYIRE